MRALDMECPYCKSEKTLRHGGLETYRGKGDKAGDLLKQFRTCKDCTKAFYRVYELTCIGYLEGGSEHG